MSYEKFIKSCYEQGIFTQNSILSYLSIKNFDGAIQKVNQLEQNKINIFDRLQNSTSILKNKNNICDLNEALDCLKDFIIHRKDHSDLKIYLFFKLLQARARDKYIEENANTYF